jgi:hypothetical protein
MSNDRLVDAINKIQDQRLRDLLLTYRTITKPAMLFEILDYLNVKVIQEKLGAIITNIEVDPFSEGVRIYLGAIVIDGELYTVELVVYNDGEAFIELMKSVDTLLYKQEVS